MERARDELFSRSRLARQEYGAVRPTHRFHEAEHVEHGTAAPDDAREALLSDGLSQDVAFVPHTPRVDQLPDSYLRYLTNGIRKELGFGAVPVRLQARASRNPFDS